MSLVAACSRRRRKGSMLPRSCSRRHPPTTHETRPAPPGTANAIPIATSTSGEATADDVARREEHQDIVVVSAMGWEEDLLRERPLRSTEVVVRVEDGPVLEEYELPYDDSTAV
uniref:Uncharacterized protein n=1 Tax=Mycena chlorophos TaxID=658473 RepID=A0ABQ0LWI5_MYCCL|nr:predicted protein [Mycena chlorophos]